MRPVLMLLVMLAGCGPSDEAAPRPAGAPQAQAPAAEPAPQAPSGAIPPGELFFVGRWAARQDLCEQAAWVITARELRTPGHVVCRFEHIDRAAAGFEIASTCTAESPPTPYRLHVSYAQSARALLIEDAPFDDVGLVRCPGGAYPSPTPARPGSPGGLPDDRTPVSEARFPPDSAQGAGTVLQTYFAHLAARDYRSAWGLWADGGKASGQDAEAFARGFAGYDSYNANVGAPGRIEGAAGTLQVTVPVQVYARLKDGTERHLLGEAVLRRSNQTPGATAEQRSWRISGMRLQPSPADR